jgi:hypothetical protein
MLRQPDKATLSAFGVPDSLFEELDLEGLKDSITNTEAKRVNSASKERFYVFPRAAGQYIVSSVEEGEVKETYQINLNSTAACSCSDFMYNCSPNGISCKHIWRIRFLIKLNCIPSKTMDPYSWLISELYKDLQWLKNQHENTKKSEEEINRLINNLTKLGRYKMDYKKIMKKRAHTLMMSEAYTL